jgi:hypothetical protein
MFAPDTRRLFGFLRETKQAVAQREAVAVGFSRSNLGHISDNPVLRPSELNGLPGVGKLSTLGE